jgi:hypothetical protein
MRSIPLHIYNEIREGHPVYAELPASGPEFRCWVTVKASKDRFHGPEQFPDRPWYYVVYKFEVHKKYIEKDLDFAGEEQNEEWHTVHSFAELDDLLDRLVGDPSKWETARESDCPL